MHKKSPFLFASTHRHKPFFEASQYAIKSSLPSVIPGRVLVTPGSVVVTTGSVVVTPGSVVVTTGSVVVTTGSVVVTTGSILVTPGSVITTGSILVSPVPSELYLLIKEAVVLRDHLKTNNNDMDSILDLESAEGIIRNFA
ncbi:hypothetical protein Tco_0970705 [Tanacetum coccineum]